MFNIEKLDVRTYTMFVALIIMWIGFTYFTSNGFTNFGGSFLTSRNLSNLLLQMAITGILGTGAVLVIVSGGIDLSVGSVMGFIGCMGAALQVWYHMNTVEVILICITTGCLIGLLQGSLIAYTGVPAFIITLAGLFVFRGGVLGITKGTTIAPLERSLVYFGQAYLSDFVTIIIAMVAILFLVGSEIRRRIAKEKYHNVVEPLGKMVLRCIGYSAIILIIVAILNSYRGLPVPVFIMLFLVLIFSFVAEKTIFGRKLYAIGGNIEAARYSGINVEKNMSLVYALNGFMAAIAGLILAGRLNAGTPEAGLNLELDAIAAAVIGGASLTTGGVGRVAGAILGGLIMTTMDNGMSMMNLDAYWQYIVKGIILAAAVWFDVKTKKGRTKVKASGSTLENQVSTDL
ncbi:sugar ABC transporter permease [Lucifera butyrica]|uniref:sugar ABC transporter permease n=1 Tax=Lucifera butyrica TaxID=1351585 RepID=UPI001A9F7EA9|nr:sugar ABC transporter permease [Lucifera butyrica]